MALKNFSEYITEFTASGQIFEFTEAKNSKGITYREFVNAPKTFKEYFELGYLHPETDWLVFQ